MEREPSLFHFRSHQALGFFPYLVATKLSLQRDKPAGGVKRKKRMGTATKGPLFLCPYLLLAQIGDDCVERYIMLQRVEEGIDEIDPQGGGHEGEYARTGGIIRPVRA